MDFAYDGRGRCVKRTLNGTNTFLYYDGWNLIDERNSSNTQLNAYVHGAMVDELLMKVDGNGSIYYHQDSIGNVVALSGASTNVIEKVSYDIYGGATLTDGSGSSITSSAYGNRFLFTGREYIKEIELYDYRNRFYMPDIGSTPDLGRFLQTDPIRFSGSEINLYRYCFNDSINCADPSGLDRWIVGPLAMDIDQTNCAGAILGDGSYIQPAPGKSLKDMTDFYKWKDGKEVNSAEECSEYCGKCKEAAVIYIFLPDKKGNPFTDPFPKGGDIHVIGRPSFCSSPKIPSNAWGHYPHASNFPKGSRNGVKLTYPVTLSDTKGEGNPVSPDEYVAQKYKDKPFRIFCVCR
jgi:RHS repeat-associated protein